MPQADQRGVDLGAQGVEREAWVWGQRALLEGLLDNLLDNALRHGRPDQGSEARVTVVLRATALTAGQAGFELSVQDNGRGVALARREALQDRWQRGAEAGLAADGHGLGLSIVSSYARFMNARLTLGDSPEGGLSVRLMLVQAPTPTRAA